MTRCQRRFVDEEAADEKCGEFGLVCARRARQNEQGKDVDFCINKAKTPIGAVSLQQGEAIRGDNEPISREERRARRQKTHEVQSIRHVVRRLPTDRSLYQI
jgi:hypothetical protein